MLEEDVLGKKKSRMSVAPESHVDDVVCLSHNCDHTSCLEHTHDIINLDLDILGCVWELKQVDCVSHVISIWGVPDRDCIFMLQTFLH